MSGSISCTKQVQMTVTRSNSGRNDSVVRVQGSVVSGSDDGLIPSAPRHLKVSTKRTEELIKIRWEEPQHNAHAVSYYEMQLRSKKTGWAEISTSTKCSAKATNLASDTKYFFRVRAFDCRGHASAFSNEIAAETRLSMATRAVLSPLVFLGGTVAGPLLGAVGGGVVAGNAAKEKIDNKAGAATAGAAAGVAGAAGGAVIGTVGAPLVGGVAAHRFVHGQAWSPQSSDDER